jgi:hypothetical protein
VAWTWEEFRFAIGAPIAVGVLAILYGLSRGDATLPLELGPIRPPRSSSALRRSRGGGIYVLFWVAAVTDSGRWPCPGAGRPGRDPRSAEPMRRPAGCASGRLGPARRLAGVRLLVMPIGLYVVSYIPWAMVENHQLWGGAVAGTGWPLGHTGQTLLELTSSMYGYHNNLSSAHPASSPWWAWAFDLKPVWFYEEGFAGGTSGSIYDAGNLVAWWLGVPAMGFVAWQAFRRRSAALAIIAIGSRCQWISWARIDRAAFQYHYYTSLPFLFLALAYFLAELWHGTSRRIWLLRAALGRRGDPRTVRAVAVPSAACAGSPGSTRSSRTHRHAPRSSPT